MNAASQAVDGPPPEGIKRPLEREGWIWVWANNCRSLQCRQKARLSIQDKGGSGLEREESIPRLALTVTMLYPDLQCTCHGDPLQGHRLHTAWHIYLPHGSFRKSDAEGTPAPFSYLLYVTSPQPSTPRSLHTEVRPTQVQLLAARTEVLAALRQESAVQRQSTEERTETTPQRTETTPQLDAEDTRAPSGSFWIHFRHWTSIRQQDRCSLLHLAFVIPGEEESLPVYTVH